MALSVAEHLTINDDWASKAFNINNRENLSLQIFVKGTHDLEGNFSLQMSNFPSEANSWEKIPFTDGEDTLTEIPIAGEENFNAVVSFVEYGENIRVAFEITDGEATDVNIRIGIKE